jgi:uncharacterized protein (TIGR03437 family)
MRPKSLARPRIMRSILAAGLAVAGPFTLRAQDTLVSIDTPRGVEYRVDSRTYAGPSTFTWPKDSKHIIEFVARPCPGDTVNPLVQFDPNCRIRYQFGEWTTNKGALLAAPSLIFSADPSITNLQFTVTALYRVDLALPGNSGTGPQPIPTQPLGPRKTGDPVGLACVNGGCYGYGEQLWLAVGEHTLQAYPFEGYAFTGWTFDGGPGQPFQGVFRVPGPLAIKPNFAPAKRVEVYTDPFEMKVLIDKTEVPTIDPLHYRFGNRYPTPGFFDWVYDSVHVLSAPSPQFSRNGELMVLDRWSTADGAVLGGHTAEYKVTSLMPKETLIAKFVPGVRVFFDAPAGLKVNVDGRENWASYNFVWGTGSKHTFSAPAEQFDKNGRKYLFKGWSNGGPASQEIEMKPDMIPIGVRLKAEYELQGMLVVQSSLADVNVTVGTRSCATPCTVHGSIGSDVTVSAPDYITLAPGSRLEFTRWADGGSRERSVKLGQEPVVLAAAFQHGFLLSAVAFPEGSADIQLEPPSADGYYPFNTQVKIFSFARPGYKFRRWDGDATGVFSPTAVTVGGPRSLRAIYDVVPHISPAGIRNAAGETPVTGVAPGSVIAIYGASLAPEYVAGSAPPLQQVLGGTSVHVGNSILPLFFVSSTQINAQLPFDLPEGTRSLTVRNDGRPDVTATFDVVRTAPALFSWQTGNISIVSATKAAGAAITMENPARPGELITLLGTGFGPHRIPPPEGFPVAEAPDVRLLDAVDIILRDRLIAPEYAGAGKLPGVVMIRFRVPTDLCVGVSEVAVRVNGTMTNVLSLPLSQSPASQEETQR